MRSIPLNRDELLLARTRPVAPSRSARAASRWPASLQAIPLRRSNRCEHALRAESDIAPAATEHGAVSAALLSPSSSSYPVTVVGPSLTLKWRSRCGAETIRYPLTRSGFLAMSARTAAT